MCYTAAHSFNTTPSNPAARGGTSRAVGFVPLRKTLRFRRRGTMPPEAPTYAAAPLPHHSFFCRALLPHTGRCMDKLVGRTIAKTTDCARPERHDAPPERSASEMRGRASTGRERSRPFTAKQSIAAREAALCSDDFVHDVKTADEQH